MVSSDVAAESQVLGAENAENADGELALEKWLATTMAEVCTDEYIDDPQAKRASEHVQGDDDLSETLSDTFAHDPCEYDEDGFEGEPLVANADDPSSSRVGEVVTTPGVGLDDASVPELRCACAQRRASVHETRVRATSTFSTPILRATISLVEHESACFCPLGRPYRQDVSSDISGQVQPNHAQRSVYDSGCLSVGLPLGCGG